MSSWARVGVKCVLINDDKTGGWLASPMPPLGETLEVVGIIPDVMGRGPHLRIRGYPNNLFETDVGWRSTRFRPLITPEQDIALFHALCPGLPVVPPAVVPKRVTVTTPSD